MNEGIIIHEGTCTITKTFGQKPDTVNNCMAFNYVQILSPISPWLPANTNLYIQSSLAVTLYILLRSDMIPPYCCLVNPFVEYSIPLSVHIVATAVLGCIHVTFSIGNHWPSVWLSYSSKNYKYYCMSCSTYSCSCEKYILSF